MVHLDEMATVDDAAINCRQVISRAEEHATREIHGRAQTVLGPCGQSIHFVDHKVVMSRLMKDIQAHVKRGHLLIDRRATKAAAAAENLCIGIHTSRCRHPTYSKCHIPLATIGLLNQLRKELRQSGFARAPRSVQQDPGFATQREGQLTRQNHFQQGLFVGI